MKESIQHSAHFYAPLDSRTTRLLQIGDVVWRDGRLYVHVKEYRIHDWVRTVEHIAPVVIGQEQAVWRLVKGRALEERVFHRPALPVPPWRVIYTCGGNMGGRCTSSTIQVEDCQGQANVRLFRRGTMMRPQPEKWLSLWVAQRPIR